MEDLKIRVYRHKFHKDIYLARNWNYCGGGPKTDFYFATRDLIVAIKDANRKDFMSWHNQFKELVAKIVDRKEVSIDGYTGTVTKELSFPVSDFEPVWLVESHNTD